MLGQWCQRSAKHLTQGVDFLDESGEVGVSSAPVKCHVEGRFIDRYSFAEYLKAVVGNAGIDAAAIVLADAAFGQTDAFETGNHPADRTLVEIDSVGEVLHPHLAIGGGRARGKSEKLGEPDAQVAL